MRRALLTLALLMSSASALVVESPDCRLIAHVPSEFTNNTLLSSGGLQNYQLARVSPFTACEPLRGQNLTEKVALVLRGDCNFVQKVWNAQRAHAVAVVVMDNELRQEAPYHIIMMKNDMASNVYIPSVFISYASGEWLLDVMSRAVSWDPLMVTIDSNGELPQASTSNRLLKRVFAYILLISVVCAFSIGFNSLLSGAFRWLGKARRTRVAKQLPIATYERNMQRALLQDLLEDQFVLDRNCFTATGSATRSSNHLHMENEQVLCYASPCGTEIAVSKDKDLTIEKRQKLTEVQKIKSMTDKITDWSSADSDTEKCSICLDNFEDGVDVKILPCWHIFHVDCINPWLEGQNERCPLCKQDVIITGTLWKFGDKANRTMAN